MVTTDINESKQEKVVLGDQHKQFPSPVKMFERMIMNEDVEENISDLENSLNPQGGMMSSLFGDIKVEMNHRVPQVDQIFTDFNETIGGFFNPFKTGVKKFTFSTVRELVIYTTIFWLLAFVITGCSRKSFKYYFIISWGLLNLCVAYACLIQDDLFKRMAPVVEDLSSQYSALCQMEVVETYPTVSGESVQEENINPQSGLDENFMASILLGLLALGLGLKPKSNGLNVVKEYLRLTPIMKGNALMIVSSALTALKNLSEKVGCDEFVSTIFDVPVVETSVEEFITKVNDFINAVNTNTDVSYENNTLLYTSFVRESKEIERTLMKGSLSMTALQDLMRNLEKCKNNMNRKFQSLKGSRPEPVMVFFTGPPSTMKTTLTNQFAYMLNMVTLPDESLPDFEANEDTYIYRKSVEKWWDGYTSKAHVSIIDDLFQVVDNANEPGSSEAAMIIRMTNSEEFAVPIAEATGKGATFFRSGFILATSNLKDASLCHSVHSKTAVRRRMHFYVSVDINEKYKKGDQIDWSTLPNINPDVNEGNIDCKTFPMDFWDLKYNEVVGADIPDVTTPISFQDLFELVVKRYYKHLQWYEINKTSQKESLNLLRKNIQESVNVAKSNYKQLRESLKASYVPFVPSIFPQSGVSDESDRSYATCSDESYGELREKVQDRIFHMSNLHRDSMILCFHRVVHVYCPNELWTSDPFSRFVDSLSSHDLKELYTLIKFDGFEDLQYEVFSDFVVSVMKERKLQNLNSVSGEPLPVYGKMKNFGESLVNGLNKCGQFISQNLPLMLLVVSVSSVTLYGIHKIVKSMNGSFESQSGNTDRYISKGPARGKAKKNATSNKIRTTNISHAGDIAKFLNNGVSFKHGITSVNNNVLTSVIDKYHFIIYVHETTPIGLKIRRLGHCVNVKSNKFLMPYHFILEMEDYLENVDETKCYMVLTTASCSRKFKVSVGDFIKNVHYTEASVAKDFCLVEMGYDTTCVGAMKYFVDSARDIVQNHKQFPITIIGTQHVENDKMGVAFRIIETQATFQKEEIYIKTNWKMVDDSTHYELDNVLRYTGSFAGGDCGSIVSLENGNYGSKVLLGIHLAGSNRIGYCSLIEQKDIQKLLDVCSQDIAFVDELEPQGLTPVFKLNLDCHEPSMDSIGIFDPAHSTSLCGKSDIVKSVIYNRLSFPETRNDKMPAMLMPKVINGEYVDPKAIALQNYARDAPVIDDGVLSEACRSYFNLLHKFDNYTSIYKRTVPTVNEALHAFGDHISGIASSTSAGWPMNTRSTEDLKKIYYKSLFEGDLELNHLALEQIEQEIDAIEKQYDDGVRPVFVYSDALKDETRPIEKALAGKTRMFSGCPFYLLVMFRRYFGRFLDFYFDANLDVGSAIGINPYSRDWHELALNLTKFSTNCNDVAVGAGDYSKFDCSETPEVLWGVYSIIEAWYGTEDRASKIRNYLWKEITNSRHIFENQYYVWKNGMPSGNPMTAVINTMYNHVAFRMSFHYCGNPISAFNSNVYLCALGDDNVFTVSDTFQSSFNELTMVDAMAKVGLIYTTELKGEATVPFRRLTEVEFLKRSFKPFRLQGQIRYLAPIGKSSIFGMINWTKRGRNSMQITCDNISLAIRELSLHGKEAYDKYVPELKRVRETFLPGMISVHPEYMSFRDTLSAVLEMEHRL